MNLRDLQLSFSQEILFGQDSGVQPLIHAGEFDSVRRLQIYRNNIRSTLTESLQAIFSVTEAMVGSDYFNFLARQYVIDHPPEEGNIHQFGNQFPQYVQTVEGLENFAYLADIALIDWACHTAYHASSAPSVGVDYLAQFAPDEYENLLLHQHPSVTILSSSFPVFDIWNFALKSSEETQVPDMNAAGQYVLIVCNDLTVEVINLERELFHLLEMSKQNCLLGSMLAYIIDSNSAYNLETGLHKLFSTGAISNVSIGTDDCSSTN